MVTFWPLLRKGVVFALLTVTLVACGAFAADSTPPPTAIPQTPEGTPVSGGTDIEPGALLAAVLQDENDAHRFSFQGEPGMTVTIDMMAAPGHQLDSYLELYAPDGTVLASDDDAGQGLDARLSDVVLPQQGQYVVLAQSVAPGSHGAYSLQMTLGEPVPTATPLPPPGGGEMAIGAMQDGELVADGHYALWTFEARSGDIVTLDLRAASVGFDPYVELSSPSGMMLIVDDDSGDNLDARIENYPLAETGTYTIRVSGLNGTYGVYQLVLDEGLPPTQTPAPPTPGPSPTPFDQTLELGQVVTGSVAPRSAGDRMVFRASEPMMVEMTIQAADGQSMLYVDLFDPDGHTHMIVNFANAAPIVFLPNLVLDQAGEYTFRISTNQNYVVDYSMSLVLSQLVGATGGTLMYNQSVSGELLYAGQEDSWAFEGRAGDVVTIMMNGPNPTGRFSPSSAGGRMGSSMTAMDSYLKLVGPEGTVLIQNDDAVGGSQDAQIDAFRLPADGTYAILASTFRGSGAGQYRLRLYLVE